MKSFIESLKSGADSYRADCAREKELMEKYGFSPVSSSGSEKDGVLYQSAKMGSTIPLPAVKKDRDAIVKEWKTLSARLRVIRAFQTQEGMSYGHLRQLAELAEAALKAQDDAKAAEAAKSASVPTKKAA